MAKQLKKIFGAAIFLIVIYFVANNIYTNYSQIENYDWNVDYVMLVVASIITLASFIFPVFAWRFLVLKLGGKIKIKDSLEVWFISNLGRYIPGKIWQLTGLVHLAKKKGVSYQITTTSMVFAQIIFIGLGLLFGFFVFSEKYDIPNYLPIGSTVIFVILLIFPNLIKKLIEKLAKFVKKDVVIENIKSGDILKYTLLLLINWLFMGISFYIFLLSFSSVETKDIFDVIAILPATWTIGLIAVFAPGGIGVREGLMTLTLTGICSTEIALVVPWLHRIFMTILEFGLASYFYLTRKKDL